MLKLSTIILKKKDITDFAQARNEALKRARSDWVLFLDSDETLTPALENEINKIPSDTEFNGFYLKRKGMVEEKLLRLAKKGSGFWQRKIHEVWQIKGKIGYLNSPILHRDNRNLFDRLKKINFYSSLHSEANYQEGKKATLLKIIFYPKFNFLQNYIIKKGYKSGLTGFVFCLLQSFQSFLSWTKLYFFSF